MFFSIARVISSWNKQRSFGTRANDICISSCVQGLGKYRDYSHSHGLSQKMLSQQRLALLHFHSSESSGLLFSLCITAIASLLDSFLLFYLQMIFHTPVRVVFLKRYLSTLQTMPSKTFASFTFNEVRQRSYQTLLSAV